MGKKCHRFRARIRVQKFQRGDEKYPFFRVATIQNGIEWYVVFLTESVCTGWQTKSGLHLIITMVSSPNHRGKNYDPCCASYLACLQHQMVAKSPFLVAKDVMVEMKMKMRLKARSPFQRNWRDRRLTLHHPFRCCEYVHIAFKRRSRRTMGQGRTVGEQPRQRIHISISTPKEC